MVFWLPSPKFTHSLLTILGAAIAVMVARLIDKVGLLINDADDEVYAKLYKLSRNREWSDADINHVKEGHECKL